MNKTRYRRRVQHGFSLVEVLVANSLLVLLAALLANTWIGLARPLLQTTSRCRIANESDLALACLARDLGGCLAGDEGSVGAKSAYRLVGRIQPAGAELWLCFDGGLNPNGLADWVAPDVVIVYQVVNHALIRSDQLSGHEFVVARNVNSLELTDVGGAVEITLTFAYRGVVRTYTLIAKDP